jgi:hypothetical protein
VARPLGVCGSRASRHTCSCRLSAVSLAFALAGNCGRSLGVASAASVPGSRTPDRGWSGSRRPGRGAADCVPRRKRGAVEQELGGGRGRDACSLALLKRLTRRRVGVGTAVPTKLVCLVTREARSRAGRPGRVPTPSPLGRGLRLWSLALPRARAPPRPLLRGRCGLEGGRELC